MTYEDFLAAWKKLNTPAQVETEPRFTIENIKITGQTRGDRAELKLHATIRVLTDGPVNVPLGLVGAILQGDPHFDRPGSKPESTKESAAAQQKSNEDYLVFDPKHGGFVARIAGKPGDLRTLSFDLIVPLVRDGAETALALSCPRATSSTLTVVVDSPITEPRASSGSVTSNKSAATGGTQIDVAGVVGQFRLTWQSANSQAASITSVLNAVGAVQISIDGRGVRSDARLTVRSFGGAFDQFRIRLPRGAKLIRDPAAAGNQDSKYRISEESVSAPTRKPGDNDAQIALVELKEKQQGPVVIDFSTEQPGQDVSQAIELSGFEVVGAVRQYGDIGLNVAKDWQARWNAGHNVRQVDPSELVSSLQRSDLTAAFQYDRQPWSLAVTIAPRQSRVHVTPQYDLELLPDEARLTMRLAYQNFGNRTYKFQIEMDGWELSSQPMESSGLIDLDNVSTSSTGTLTLPFTQASSRKAEVSVSLRHALDRDATSVKLPLPLPIADSVATGDLTVHAPADISLLPDLVNSTGLAAAPIKETATLSDSDVAPELHFRSLLPNAVFAASRTPRSRESSAQVAAQVEIENDSMLIGESIDYQVRFEPVKELQFECPSDFPINGEGAEVSLLISGNGKAPSAEQRVPLHFEPVADESAFTGTGNQHLRVTLPQPRVGKFTISVHYPIPNPQPVSAGSALQVPLLLPADSRVSSQHVSVRAPHGMFLSLGTNADASSWKIDDLPRKNPVKGRSGHEFVTDRPEAMLPLLVSAADTNAPSTTVVERVWLQTWISGGIEQDRTAFNLRSSNSNATIELPPEAPAGEVEVLVDGQTAQVVSRAKGRIVVRLVKDTTNRTDSTSEPMAYVLEIRFRRPIQQSLITRHRLTPPQIDSTTQLSQVCWQIVLPSDEHIVYAPDQLVSASQWQWFGSFWGHRPAMSQTDLEKWVGARSQIAPPPLENQYLFTGLLPVSSIEMVTAPRWLIVLVASSTVLTLISGWYYLPIRAKRLSLVALAAIIAVAATAFPTAALLFSQAAAIGIVLALASILISRWVNRIHRRPLTQSFTPSSRRILMPRGESIVMPSVVTGAITSPTVTLRTSDSER